MDHGLLLIAAAGVELLVAAVLPWPWGWLVAWPAAVTLVVGVATWLRRPGILGKRADGSFPLWSLVLLGTWHALYRIRGRRQHAPTQVHPGWHLGGWPRVEQFPDPPAVVDVTCELPRVFDGPYHLVVVLDRTAPTVDQLDAAVRWAVARRAEGPVLVHCAHGRGRSATVLCACLVAAGLHDSWRDAFAHIRALRPQVRLAPDQVALLDTWEASSCT